MKKIISITLSHDIIRWVEKQAKTSVQYRNKSHLIELAIQELKQKTELKDKELKKV